MNNPKYTYRVAPLPALPVTGILQANGEVRVLTAGDAGLYLATGTNVWSKLATILFSDGASGTIPAGATFTFANLIPVPALVLGVTALVTTLVTGATDFDIGDGVDVDRWGAAIAVALGTTTSIADFTIASPVYYTAANDVVLTANGGNFTGGAVSVRVHYLTLGTP